MTLFPVPKLPNWIATILYWLHFIPRGFGRAARAWAKYKTYRFLNFWPHEAAVMAWRMTR